MKKFLFLIFSFIFIMNVEAVSTDYTITNYEIIMDVNDDNTFDVKEIIDVYFYENRHGIYRIIPTINNVTRLDGSRSKIVAEISNVKVSDNYTSSYEGSNYRLQIGDADQYVIGEKTYSISYKYSIGKDKLKDKDEFYFNIIGSEWTNTIEQVTFTINMPADFDKSKIGFASGQAGSTTNNVLYTINDNTIVGYTTTPLYSGDALTIRIELSEGYFANAKNINSLGDLLAYLIPIICLAVCGFIYFKKSGNQEIVDPVTFYPPDDLNSLEVAFLYNGKVTSNDVSSLLVYLANKGYIQIEEKKSSSIFSASENVTLKKIKDYDGEKMEEQLFLEGLFKNGNSVSINSLKSSFYSTVNEILSIVNKKENKEKIINKNNNKFKFFIGLLTYLTVIISLYLSVGKYTGIGSLFLLSFILLFYIPFYVAGFATFKSQKVFGLIILLFVMFHSFFMVGGMILSFFGDSIFLLYDYIFLFILLIIVVIVNIRLITKFVYRTAYGKEMYGKILGFKTFLETAEKDKLESLVNQNPEYFYNILPFTYVLGISDKWIKKFETITIEPVKWYVGYDTFTVARFGSMMSHCMTSCKSYTTYSSGTSSGGSSGASSGGGSSGGGSGGGGGGSW